MTSQQQLDRILTSFFVTGSAELADRVIDAALEQVDHTPQRRAMRVPRMLRLVGVQARLAAAAVIVVLVVGGALLVLKPSPSVVGTPTASPAATDRPSTLAPSPQASLRTGLTGPLVVGRQIHTATRLTDGRVLVVGGYDVNDDMVGSAVVYDPSTGTFTATGSLATARGTHTATLLADGRVLIAGGGPTAWNHSGAFLASAELYDPVTGTFTATGSMATPREGHTATLLADGRVLVAGGIDINGHAVASAELYDPATGTFTAAGAMTASRSFHSATLLADGRVLIAGGAPDAWTFTRPSLASAEIYDPKAGAFTATGPMSTGRGWHTATLLADGRVLLAGGDSGASDKLSSAEVYDPSAGTFKQTGEMAFQRLYQTATLLADGRVLVAGGGADYTNLQFLSAAELYDPTTGTWSATGPMADARTYHQATLLGDGRVLVTGGYGAVAPLANAELYQPATGSWSLAGG